jgi:ankyrin repeat protein
VGWTPFTASSSTGHLEVAKWLWDEAGAAATPKQLAQGINAACTDGKLECVEYLRTKCPSGFKFNQKNRIGSTPFIDACGHGSLNTAKWLWTHVGGGHEIDMAQRQAAAISACTKGHVHVLVWLRTLGLDINDCVDVKASMDLLAIGCANNHIKLVQYLIEELDIPDVNRKDSLGISSFHYTCLRGHTDLAQWIHGNVEAVELNTLMDLFRTPFVDACINGWTKMAKWLWTLEVEVLDEQLSVAYHDAAELGYLDILEFLESVALDSINPNLTFSKVCTCDDCKRSSGSVAFALACRNGHIETAKHLIKKHARIISANAHHAVYTLETPYTLACGCGHLEIVKWLVDEIKVSPTQQQMVESMLSACENGRIDVVKWLHANGTDVAKHNIHDGVSPFMVACANNRLEVAKFIRDVRGSELDMNHRDNTGVTPFQIACLRGHLKLAKWLLRVLVVSCKRDPATVIDNMDKAGRTPIVDALANGYMDVARWLKGELEVRMSDDLVRKAFHAACSNGWVAALEFLYSDHADVIATTAKDTSLHCAVYHGREKVVRWVTKTIHHNDAAKTDVLNDRNFTPAAVAASEGFHSIAAFLLEHGASLDSPRKAVKAGLVLSPLCQKLVTQFNFQPWTMQSHARQPPRFRDVAWAMLYVWKQGSANLPFDVPFEVWACILNQLVGRDFQLCGAIGCTNIGQRTCSGCKSARYCSAECQKQTWKAHKVSCYARSEFDEAGIEASKIDLVMQQAMVSRVNAVSALKRNQNDVANAIRDLTNT